MGGAHIDKLGASTNRSLRAGRVPSAGLVQTAPTYAVGLHQVSLGESNNAKAVIGFAFSETLTQTMASFNCMESCRQHSIPLT